MEFNCAKKDIILHTIVYSIHMICMEINCAFSKNSMISMKHKLLLHAVMNIITQSETEECLLD